MAESTNSGEPLDRFLGAVQTLGRDDFTRTYPYPFLLECVTSQAAAPTAAPRKTKRISLTELELAPLPVEPSQSDRRVFPLSTLTEGTFLVIGRGEGVALHVDGEEVSIRHGRLSLDEVNGNAIYEDLGSTNGTFINGEPVTANTRVTLNDGDILSLGGKRDFQFCFAPTFHGILRRQIRGR